MIAHRVKKLSEAAVPRRGGYAWLVRYLIDPQNKYERVGAVTITNCHSPDPRFASLEVLAVQAQNKRVEENKKTYHLVIGFPPGEVPAPEVLQAIETTLVERLGFAEHQRISVVHHDKDHLHVHVAICKVHPVRLTVLSPKGDFYTLGKACEELELKYGLQQVNHVPRRGRSQGAEDMEKHSGFESLVSWARAHCLPSLTAASSWQELHRVAEQHGLRVQLRGAGCVLVHGDIAVRASSVARELALRKLVERLGPFEVALDAHKARSVDRGRSPNVEPQRDGGRRARQPDGDDLHRDIAEAARGAGQDLEQFDDTYRRRPAASARDTGALFAQYEHERERAGVERVQRLGEVDSSFAREIAAAKRKAKMRRFAIKLFGKGRTTKRVLYEFAYRALRRELDAIRTRHRQGKRVLSERTKRTSWTEWLQVQASAGNDEALLVLRARLGAKPLRGDVIGGQTLQTTRVPVAAQVTKAGVLVYRIGQVVVREDATAIRVGHGANMLELREVLVRAAQRHGPVLHVEGGEEFRRNVALVAALSGLRLRFDDAPLEHQRQAYRSQYERRKPSNTTRVSEPNADSPAGPRTARTDRVRDVPPRGLARERRGRESVLPGFLHGHVEPERAARDHAVRRGLSRVGRAGALPPAVRARRRIRAAAAAREVADRRAAAKARGAVGAVPPAGRARGQVAVPTTAAARSVRPPSAPRAVARTGGVGTTPPPVRPTRGHAASAVGTAAPRNAQVTPARFQPALPVGAVGKRPPPWCRHRLLPMSTLDARGGRPLPPQRPDPVALYVREREGKRQRGLDVPKHQAWVGKAGRYVFAGRREVAGTPLVLLRDGEDVVVMQIRDSQQAGWWGRQRIGQVVVLDARGGGRGRGR